MPRLFDSTRAVIPDELHTVLDSERGIHMRSLLARLERPLNHPIRRVDLSATLNAAIEEGVMDRSPMVPIRNRQYEHDLPDPFTREEMEAILAHLRDHDPGQVWHWHEFAFATGMRPSEQIALLWKMSAGIPARSGFRAQG